MNFVADLRDEVMKWLPYDRANAGLAAELSALPTSELVGRFFNWLDRLIHKHPREVVRSRQYVHRWSPPREQVYLERIISEIETGKDLSPRLSRGIVHGFVTGAPITAKRNLGRKQDLDLLLNEWGIHHLHLPDVIDSDGFVRRDASLDADLLLFAIFRNDKAYLIDVLPHGEWTNENLVEIAVRNWPDDRLFVPLHGAIELSQTLQAGDRQKLRSAGINALIQIDGKVFISDSGGLTSAGTSGKSSQRAIRLLHTLADLEKKIRVDPFHLRAQITEGGHVFPDQPEFRLIFINTANGNGFAVREAVTGSVMPVGSP